MRNVGYKNGLRFLNHLMCRVMALSIQHKSLQELGNKIENNKQYFSFFAE